MTEAELLSGTDPMAILEFLRGKASDRKLRLFGCACCRRVWHVLDDERCRSAIEVAERFVEGEATNEERNRAFRAACKARDRHPQPTGRRAADERTCAYYAVSYVVGAQGTTAARNAAAYVLRHFEWKDPDHLAAERARIRNLSLDVFGNPFRPVAVEPDWRTSTVIALATGIDESLDFTAFPILADALQDAGCENPDLLNHCREAGDHARGCWAIDAILGKS
jgi:hypothetical protein